MRLATLLALLLALPACDTGFWETSDRVPLRVDIQSQFDDDRVRIEVAGVPVYDQRVTTADVVGLAEIVEVVVPPGTTTFDVTVGDRPTASVELNPATPATVAVNFDGERVTIQPLSMLPLYD